MTRARVFLLTVSFLLGGATRLNQPNLIFVLVDDWGSANAGFQRDPSWPGDNETQTPNIDRLARGGLIIDRHYVYKLCSPTRSALQTGRNPIHVNVVNSPISQYNLADPEAGFQGAARSFTGIAEKLRGVGFSTHLVGKWNAGMALHKQTPSGRGYDSSLYYYDYDTFFWNGTVETCTRASGGDTMMTDLSTSINGGPATPAWGMNNTWRCSQTDESVDACPHGYQDDLFMRRVEEVIANSTATPDSPLFLFWAPHAPHDPYEVPAVYLEKFAAIDVEPRRYYMSMVNYLDDNFGRLEAALRAAGRWENTLVVVSSDNGGPVGGRFGANNFPLRGGKASNFEGGIRVNSFAFGGALDPALAGTRTAELTAIEDWWTTFSLLGGANTTDAPAAAAGLPPVDGFDLRGLLLPGGNRTSPRTRVVIGDATDEAGGDTLVGGIITNEGWKLLRGHIGNPFWQGPIFPNRSVYPTGSLVCNPCLFNVFTDPHELEDVASANPDIVARLVAEVDALQRTVWNPDRGNSSKDGLACEKALGVGRGFWMPFLD